MRRPRHRSYDRPAPTASGALLTSAQVGRLRQEASAAAQAVHDQRGTPYVGFVRRRAAQASPDGSAAVRDESEARPFSSEADMWGWMRDLRSYPASYDYAALFDQTGPAWPLPITEDAPGRP